MKNKSAIGGMKRRFYQFAFPWFFLSSCLLAWGQADMRKGLTQILANDGATSFLDAEGKPLPPTAVEINDALPEGVTVVTGADGMVVLLFSNGTVVTIQEDSRLQVKSFVQEAFDAKGKKMEDLVEEPSESNLQLDLETGSLVVGTKSLRKGSVMGVETKRGVAGIRGTQFQLGQQPGGAMNLDVTESKVKFTPTGGGPTTVNANRGLDVAPAGGLTIRPVNPVVARNITKLNAVALNLAAKVSLDAVSAKMEKASDEDDEKGEKDEDDEESEDSKDSGGGDSEGPPPPPNRPSVNQDQVLEGNSDLKAIRELGSLDKRISRLLRQGFTMDQLLTLFGYPVDLQELLLLEKPGVLQRLLDVKPVTDNLRIYYTYAVALRGRLLEIENDLALGNFIYKGYDEVFADALLTTNNLNQVNAQGEGAPGALDEPSGFQLFETTGALLDQLIANGNEFILAQLLESGGGALTAELIEAGLEADFLLSDVSMSGDFDASRLFDGDVLENPFYLDAASVWTLTKSDLGLGDYEYVPFAGRNVALQSGTYDYGPYLSSSADYVIVSAAGDMQISGEVAFDAGSASVQPCIVLMSGGSITSDSGTTLSHALSDLILTARDDIDLTGTTISVGNYLDILGQGDVTITDGSLQASGSIHLQAAKKLHLDSVQFSQNLPSLYLQATTVNLRNLDFPSGSYINASSLKGAIDGKYPNFGSESYGRVNFIQNVKYGGNLMDDRTSFDLHGQNITIGKIPGQ